jgi:hypothetical protein
VFLGCLLLAGIVQIRGQEQHPILDQAANKVIQKYQNASCQQLWAERQQHAPPTPAEAKAIQFLHSDPQMRAPFINKVAAPVANKLFECGMIPRSRTRKAPEPQEIILSNATKDHQLRAGS